MGSVEMKLRHVTRGETNGPCLIRRSNLYNYSWIINDILAVPDISLHRFTLIIWLKQKLVTIW